MVYNMEIAIRDKMKEMELKGKQEGKLETILKVVKKIICHGMDIEQISVITEMPIDELQELIADYMID